MRVKRILMIEDHEIVREGLKRILDEHSIPAVVGEAGDPSEALKLASEREWDVAVLALSLGGSGGLEVLKELKRIRAQMPVLVFTMRSEAHYARRAFKAGAAGYSPRTPPEGKWSKQLAR